MSTSDERLRQRPDDRFAASTHKFDLEQVATSLHAEPVSGQRLHRQETIYRHGPVTVALFLFEVGGKLPQHVAGGVVTVHVLHGHLKMSVEGEDHELTDGKMLVMAPGVRHDVLALETTRMLLTVCLLPSKDGA